MGYHVDGLLVVGIGGRTVGNLVGVLGLCAEEQVGARVGALLEA